MKKLILLILTLIVISPAISYSQELFIGPKAGLRYYKVRFIDPLDGDDFKSNYDVGYAAGITIVAKIPQEFSLGADLYFSRMGRNLDFEPGINNSATYNFIEAAPHIRKNFKLNLGRNLEPGDLYLSLGPNISYWLGGSGTLSTPDQSFNYDVSFGEVDSTQLSTHFIEGANRFLVSFDFGIGVGFPVSRNQYFYAELKYTLGNTFLGDQGDSFINFEGFDDNLRSQYRVIQLSAAYVFKTDPRTRKKGKSVRRRR